MSDDKLFDYILARSRTRESSTLTIATVASTGSLVLIALFLQPSTNQQSNLSMQMGWSIQLFGILFVVTGVVYREVTKYTIHQNDEQWLKDRAKGRDSNDPKVKNLVDYQGGSKVREGVLRALLIMPIIAWSFVLDSSAVTGTLVAVLCSSYVIILGLRR